MRGAVGLTAILVLSTRAAVHAQDTGPPQYQVALDRLAAADTAAALAQLRAAARADRHFGPAFFRLGAVLSARATFEVGYQAERVEAEAALRRAAQLMPDDPLVLLEIGLLFRKQDVRVDARRVLARAEAAARRRGEALPPAERARLEYQLGLIYESYWEDRDRLVTHLPLGMLNCPIGAGPTRGDSATVFAMLAGACPGQLDEALRHTVFLAGKQDDEYAQMLGHFRAALRADSGRVDAGLRLLGYLADDVMWDEYDRLLRRLLAVRPDNARLHLFRALGLHERGRSSAADSAFRRALALMTPTERMPFRDITVLVPRSVRTRYASLDSAGREETARRFFAGSDPLYLSTVDERRLEHWARVAWSELRFAAPEAGQRGWDTDRGRIWIRYGPPVSVFQCCFGTNGRTIYWSYGPAGPVFSFKRLLTHRYARHTPPSHQLAEDELAEYAPQTYRPHGVTAVYDYPHQLARFRGSRSELVRVEVYAAAPVDSLGVVAGPVETGIFVFDADYQPMWQDHRMVAPDEATALGYRFEVRPGTLRYGLEARAAGPEGLSRPVARVRDTLVAAVAPGGHLAISDLLLAESLEPRVEPARRRADLVMRPSRTLAFAAGDPVHLYFELYNLRAGKDSLAHYAVRLGVEGTTGGGIVARIARGVTRLFSGERDVRVEFERAVPLVDDRTIDYLSLELRAGGSGDYVLRVEVTDTVSGEGVRASRGFRVVTVP